MTCQEQAIAQLREAGLRLTPQRAMVLEAIYHGHGHLTAEEVYEQVQSQSPFVDLSTVYRTLAFLKQHGLVGDLQLEGDRTRYEAIRSGQEHHHAICTSCGCMLKIDPSDLDALVQALEAKHGFRANLVHMTIPGLCADCLAHSEAP